MKFVNFAEYRDFDRIAGVRGAHFAYADPMWVQGGLQSGVRAPVLGTGTAEAMSSTS